MAEITQEQEEAASALAQRLADDGRQADAELVRALLDAATGAGAAGAATAASAASE